MNSILKRIRKAFFYTLLLVVTVCFLYIFFILLFSAGVFMNVDEVSRILQMNSWHGMGTNSPEIIARYNISQIIDLSQDEAGGPQTLRRQIVSMQIAIATIGLSNVIRIVSIAASFDLIGYIVFG